VSAAAQLSRDAARDVALHLKHIGEGRVERRFPSVGRAVRVEQLDAHAYARRVAQAGPFRPSHVAHEQIADTELLGDLPRRLGRAMILPEPEIPVGLSGIVDAQNVGMVELGERPDLTAKTIRADGLGELRIQDLERDAPSVLHIVGEIDRGHSAASELPLQPIFSAERMLQFVWDGQWHFAISRTPASFSRRGERRDDVRCVGHDEDGATGSVSKHELIVPWQAKEPAEPAPSGTLHRE
jgi:hypothetical protein